MAAFAPEVLFQVGPLPVTNTLINTFLIDTLLVGTAVLVGKNLKRIPGKLQNVIEMIVEEFYKMTAQVSGKNAKAIFPWFITFFLFIILANWSGLIPGVGTIGIWEETSHHTAHGTETEKHLVPIMRNLTSDLNATLALAIVSLVATHLLAIRTLGFALYIGRYISLNPIMLYVGLLELVSEFTKVISLSFRLFGNIYAGEVVLITISSLFAFLAPIPFMLLEVIVGLVQALVFGMLTLVFMSVLMTAHNENH